MGRAVARLARRLGLLDWQVGPAGGDLGEVLSWVVLCPPDPHSSVEHQHAQQSSDDAIELEHEALRLKSRYVRGEGEDQRETVADQRD